MRQNHTILDHHGAPDPSAAEPFDDLEDVALEIDEEPASIEELSELVAERRETLRGLMDEARERGLDALVEVALAASEPRPDGAPVVADCYILRDQLRLLEMAIEELESR